MTPAALALAFGMGLAMGLLGGGGSIIAVPVLTFALGFPPKDAVATSLVVVGFAAAAGALGSFVRGVLPARIAVTVALSAVAGAAAGGAAGARLADDTQLIILAMVMLAAAAAMWRPVPVAQPDTARGTPFLVGLGLAIGGLTGLVGVGGGFITVPALVIGAGLSMPKAAAASLFVMMLSAMSALPNYLGRTSLSWSFIVPFAAAAGVAAVIGGIVSQRLPQRRLQQSFAAALVVLASYVLIRT